MLISIDTDNLTENDKKLLRVVLGEVTTEPKTADKVMADDAVAAQLKKRAARVPKPEPEDEPQDEPQDKDGDGPTLDDAVDRATELVSDGKSAVVKKALASVGAKRVTEIPEDKLEDFLAALGK